MLSSFHTFAASEGQLLTQCKNAVKTQFENVESIRSASIKSRKNKFEAKLRVRTAGDNGVYLCTVERDGAPLLARIDKDTSQNVAAKR
ncbi:MAG: hypothetical protein ACI9FR_002521 [Cryomorphaceae bacterium]